MAYETVLSLPSGVVDLAHQTSFVRESDLERLQKMQLLYFLRTSEHQTFHDTPVMGVSEERFVGSQLTGPFETAPELSKRQDEFYERREKIIKHLIPFGADLKFKPYTLVNYGTNLSARSSFSGSVNKEMYTKARNIAENLMKSGMLSKVSEVTYRGNTQGCLLELQLDPAIGLPYPIVEFRILGEGNTPFELMHASGIKDAVILPGGRIAIDDSTQNGLGYNLSLDGKSIRDVVSSGNLLF